MANLTNTEDLSLPISRQELFNMWANATLGTIGKGDLAPGTFTMDIGTYLTGATNAPVPGHAYFAREDQLLYIFHDVIDDTGVSLWLAVGPDRFDVACLANSPVPAGAAVQYDYDKWVGPFTGASDSVADVRAFGSCAAGVDLTAAASPSTQASGTWIPVSIDGLVWGLTNGTVSLQQWLNVTDGSPGVVVRSGVPPTSGRNDVIGLGIQAVTAGGTPTNFRYIWTGPRALRPYF